MKDGLTPEELSVVAVLLNPTLRSERDRRALANAQLLQAGLLPNPQLSWDLGVPVANTQGTVNEWSLGLNWEITSLIGRSARIEAAAAQPKAVALDIAWQEWTVAETAKSAGYTLIALQQQELLVRQLDDQLRQNVNTMNKAVAAGLKTGLDLIAAEAASSQSQANLLDLESQIAQQRITLNRGLGLPAESVLPIQSDEALPTTFEPPSAEKLIECLSERRLDLVGLRYGYASQDARLRAEILAQFPKVNFGPVQSRDNSNVYMTGFGLSVDLPMFDRNQGVIAEAVATRQRLFDEYINRLFQARSDVVMLTTRINWLNQQIATAQAAQAKQQQLVEYYREAFDRGQADAVVYYGVWTTLIEKQIDTVKLQQALIEARVALELAAGVYDLRCLPLPPTAPEELPHPVRMPSTGASL